MSKLPTPAKLGLLGAAVLLALVAGWFVAIAPKRSEAAKLTRQIDETRAQIASLRAGPSRAQTPAIRIADLFTLSRAMPNRVDIPGVLLQLSRVAGETGVMFQSITPHDPVQLGSYQRISVDLVFQGRFYDLSDFLYRLRNLVGVHAGVLSAAGRLFSVDSLGFDEGVAFPQVKAKLSVSAYVFGDGTAAPVPTGVASADATPTTSAIENSQPIPAAPPGANAAGALR
jgi:hypothetical protein